MKLLKRSLAALLAMAMAASTVAFAAEGDVTTEEPTIAQEITADSTLLQNYANTSLERGYFGDKGYALTEEEAGADAEAVLYAYPSMFNEINEDFLQLRGLEPDNIEAQIGNVVYSILTVWTQRRLDSMVNREIIRMMDGYRVYTKHFTKEGLMYLKKHDVAIHSDRSNKETLDGLCDFIYYDAFKHTFTTIIWKDKNDRAHKNPKIIPYLWPEFNDKMNKAIKKETGGKYVKLKRVKVIFPPDDKTLVELLNNYFKKTRALNLALINQEAKKKALSGQKMKRFSLGDIEEFIEEFMS